MRSRPPVVLIVEKPNLSRRIAAPAAAAWPDRDILAVHTCAFAAVRFARPPAIDACSDASVPIPAFALAPSHLWQPVRLTPAGVIEPPPDMDPTALIREGEIVFACDPDPSGVVTFANIVRLVRGAGPIDCAALRLFTLAPEHIRQAFIRVERFAAFSAELEAGDRKRFFDWAWACFAAHAFAPHLHIVGVRAPGVFLSKWQLHALGLLSNGPMPEGELVAHLPGSACSNPAVVQSLHHRRLVALNAQRALTLTNQAAALLDRLPANTPDMNLPERLRSWIAMPADPRHAMLDYLRAFFAKIVTAQPGPTARQA
ncbi:hypothetical protein [Dolichospermum phage Dfl-JY45]